LIEQLRAKGISEKSLMPVVNEAIGNDSDIIPLCKKRAEEIVEAYQGKLSEGWDKNFEPLVKFLVTCSLDGYKLKLLRYILDSRLEFPIENFLDDFVYPLIKYDRDVDDAEIPQSLIALPDLR